MNEKEYVENVCSGCLNKANDNDLCNIVNSRISGKWQCANFEDKKENKEEK